MDLIRDLKIQVNTYYDSLIEFLPKLLIALVVCFVLMVIIKTIRTRSINFIKNKADDKLLVNFANSIFRIVNSTIVILLFLYIIGLGSVASSILGAAGISAFIIGFALKDIGENFLAGIIMAFDRPFKLYDVIRTGDIEGSIVSMTLRDTHIKTSDGKDVYIPNGQLIKNPLYNYTKDGFMRMNFTIGVDYSSNIDKVRSIILNTVKTIPGVLTEEKLPSCYVKNLNTNSIDLEIYIWIGTYVKEFSGMEIKSMAQSKCIENLTKANIGIPTNIMELKNYDAALKMANQ